MSEETEVKKQELIKNIKSLARETSQQWPHEEMVELPDVLREIDQLDELETNSQIDKLANFIMSEVEGEPSQSQGAVDTAIRIIKSCQNQETLSIDKEQLIKMYENDRTIVFLSGPITDNEDFYLLQFKEAEEHLTNLGFLVFNPTILPTGMSKESLMNICLAAIKECDVVYFLSGWHESKGCITEFEAAQSLHKPIFYADKIVADRT